MIPSGHYIPVNSAVHRLDPRVKLASFFLLITALIISSSLYGYCVVLIVLALVAGLSKLPKGALFASIIRLRSFFLVIFLMNAFFYSGEQALLSFGILNLTREGILQGAKLVFNVLYIMVLSNVLCGSTTPMDITIGVGSLLKPLSVLMVPVEDVAMIISIAIRFIPSLLEEAEMIKKAQTARGARFESKKLKEKALSFLPLLIPVFLSAFRRADELSIAMEARGYRNARRRTKKAKKPLESLDYAALGCSVLICIFQIYF